LFNSEIKTMSEQINIHNYQAFFLDFLEGKLSRNEREEMDRFLVDHPELQTELVEFQSLPLANEPLTYDNKLGLKKSALFTDAEGGYLTEKAIAYVEGVLTEKEVAAFKPLLVKDSKLAEDVKIFSKVKLLPDTSISYDAKPQLKRYAIIRRSSRVYYYAAAASFAVIIGLSAYLLLNKQQSVPVIKVAGTVEKPVVKEKQQVTPVKYNKIRKLPVSHYAYQIKHEQPQPVIGQKPGPVLLSSIGAIEVNKLVLPTTEKDPTMSKRVTEVRQLEIRKEKRFFRINNMLWAYGAEVVENVKQLMPERFRSVNPSNIGWDIAQAGVQRISEITGAPMELKTSKKSDNSTEVVFESGLFAFEKTIE
jgi:hypothetical protein